MLPAWSWWWVLIITSSEKVWCYRLGDGGGLWSWPVQRRCNVTGLEMVMDYDHDQFREGAMLLAWRWWWVLMITSSEKWCYRLGDGGGLWSLPPGCGMISHTTQPSAWNAFFKESWKYITYMKIKNVLEYEGTGWMRLGCLIMQSLREDICHSSPALQIIKSDTKPRCNGQSTLWMIAYCSSNIPRQVSVVRSSYEHQMYPNTQIKKVSDNTGNQEIFAATKFPTLIKPMTYWCLIFTFSNITKSIAILHTWYTELV